MICLTRRDLVAAHLEVDVRPDAAADQVQHRVEVDEPRLRELVMTVPGDRAEDRVVVDLVVVEDHRSPVGGQAYVELDEVAALRDRRLERGQGVLGGAIVCGAAPVRRHEDHADGWLPGLPRCSRAHTVASVVENAEKPFAVR